MLNCKVNSVYTKKLFPTHLLDLSTFASTLISMTSTLISMTHIINNDQQKKEKNEEKIQHCFVYITSQILWEKKKKQITMIHVCTLCGVIPNGLVYKSYL